MPQDVHTPVRCGRPPADEWRPDPSYPIIGPFCAAQGKAKVIMFLTMPAPAVGLNGIIPKPAKDGGKRNRVARGIQGIDASG